jgi:hypothetical protein
MLLDQVSAKGSLFVTQILVNFSLSNECREGTSYYEIRPLISYGFGIPHTGKHPITALNSLHPL